MEKFKIGVLRVLTTDDQQLLECHGRLLNQYFPQLITESRCIPQQYDGIYDHETLTKAIPKILHLAIHWEKELDGLIISYAGDPALEKLKKRLSIPVVGAGVATATYSMSLGEKVGVIGIEDEPPRNYKRILKENIIEYVRPSGVRTSNDLQIQSGKKAVLSAGEKLKAIGAEVIALACTGLSTAEVAPLLRKELKLPVVDPVFAEGLMMYGQCMEAKWFGKE